LETTATMNDIAQWSVTEGVAVVMLDNPPVNAISQAVREALVAGVERANRDPDVAALVIACAGRTFFAGADLKEFGKPSVEPFLTEVVDTIEASAKPVVAAIHGTALGGGLEIAMACHYRLATPDARLGLPEVRLGLMPGARGTQHLPRLVGVERALEMIAFGNPVGASEASEIGLVDELANDDLVEAARALAAKVAGKPPRRTRELIAQPVAGEVYEQFAARNARKFRGLDAPPAIIESIRAATELPFEKGARREREIFLRLREGPQNEALRYVFFAEREAARIPGLEGVTPREITSTGVVGSGTMGTGIAIALLAAGLPVTLFDLDEAALKRGMATIRKALEANVKAGRMSAGTAEKASSMLRPVRDVSSLATADIVIEAAFEKLEVKCDIFAMLDAIAKPGAVLASNTSYLDIDAIAAATARPADVFGMHFFSPANVMKLLEVVPGKETATDALATAFALARQMKKIPVLAGNAWGFIGNRMLAVRRREAERMAVEGASPQQIDAVLEGFGFAMGPFKTSDLSGLDLGWSPETSNLAGIRDRLCEAGRRGQKTGAGFYDYDSQRKPSASAQANAIIEGLARDTGVVRRAFSNEEIFDRLIWPMIDEGAKLLAEGVALRESDIDVVWLNGYGWPAWTGGPMFHARRTGIDEVVRRLEGLGYAPSHALTTLIDEPSA
jgi:3-hydroxyacyl-CoA dehydrogenase